MKQTPSPCEKGLQPVFASRSLWKAGRSRAALLWGLFGFLGLQLGMAAVIEWIFPEFRDPHYTYKARRLHQRTQEGSEKALSIVMLGSSRTIFGLHSHHIEAELNRQQQGHAIVFNFGIVGAGPLTELILLRRLLAEGVRPDVLLVEVLPPVLGGHMPSAEVNRFPPERLWHWELSWLKSYMPAPNQMRTAWWQSWPVPWYSHRFAILSRLAPALLPYQDRLDWFRTVDGSGWVDPPLKPRTPEGYQQALTRAHHEYGCYFNGFFLGGAPCQALRELLDVCRQEKIAAALVLMPEGASFRSWYPPNVWNEVSNFLKDLQREYGVATINAREWIREDDFSDSHHLLPTGAAQFSERLEREGILPLLAQEKEWRVAVNKSAERSRDASH